MMTMSYLHACRSVFAVQGFTTDCCLNSVVTIGFNPATYSVVEDTGSVNITVSVKNGTLASGVAICCP